MQSSFAVLAVALLLGTSHVSGGTWEQITSTCAGRSARLEAEQGVLILYGNHTVMSSTDKGRTWADCAVQFPNGMEACVSYGPYLGAFRRATAYSSIEFIRSTDHGRSWTWMSQFEIMPNESLVDVVVNANQMYAYGDHGTLAASTDRGQSWHLRHLPDNVGPIADVVMTTEIMVVCGTQGSMWSANQGETWAPSHPPMQIGPLRILREHNGVIWGCGQSGACQFDLDSRSWRIANNGLPTYAGITAHAESLITRYGLLFGCFRDGSGYDKVMRWSASNDQWIAVAGSGMPPQNQSGRGNIACDGPRFYLYCYGNDINFFGVYSTTNAAPVSVEERDTHSPLMVAPDPVPHTLHISVPELTEGTIRMIDMHGAVVKTIAVCRSMDVDVNDLPIGAYSLVCTTTSGTWQRTVRIVR